MEHLILIIIKISMLLGYMKQNIKQPWKQVSQ